ncbi:hypothetical protein GCG54_00015382 [Colletotrichum gloeosporioides]|uniref:ERCC4 domain-containing protein n=1 Tax=Colletotrichum gloeosporioides TaxID=474922 RepID=A0A8H4CQG5_COLGL|nr:uncharacterized protein GCG54_00015382 [Colletotrichum gloeosporioides]KAF3807997.1 hypothetical protein GCG54_00015382 [Colletotrichum gloeosporioides]
MAPPKPYFDTVSSKTEYDRLAPRAFLSDVTGKSTSGWGEAQLAACRVLVAPNTKNNLLPILLTAGCGPTEAFQKRLKLDPSSDEGNDSSDRSISHLQRICRGPQHHQPQTEHQNVWTYGQSLGQLWASLDKVKASSSHHPIGDGLGELEEARGVEEIQAFSGELDEPSDPSDPSEPDEPNETSRGDGSKSNGGSEAVGSGDNPININEAPGGDSSRKRKVPESNSSSPIPRRPKRQVKPPQHPGFARSDQIDLSSSQTTAPPIGSSPDVFYGPPSPKADQTCHPETLTVHLVSSFIRQALPWLPSQANPKADPVVMLEDAQATFQVQHGELQFTSRDDGGLVAFCDGRRRGRVALIEAKRFVDSYSEGELSLSDKRFGQMIGEALAVRFQQEPTVWAGPKETIIVIAAARHYLRFLQVGISELYLNQLKMHAQGGNDALTDFIYVSATRWLDLADASDRRHTVQNLEGIVRLVHKQLSG